MRQQSVRQKTVRIGRMEHMIQQQNETLGHKTAMSIAEYHKLIVEPRLRRLEASWIKRLWWWLCEYRGWW